MHDLIPILHTLALFRDISGDELSALLHCLRAQEKHYPQQQYLLDPIGSLPFIVVLVTGSILVMQEDWRGNRSIVGDLRPGDFLGESALGIMHSFLPVCLSIQAGTRLLLLDPNTTLTHCEKRCHAHFQLMCNMVELSLQKELRLVYRIEHLSRRSVREKIVSYLTIQSAVKNSRILAVPYTRQELADILVVDRSTLCTELARMQNEGLIRYRRQQFELLD